MSICAVPRCGQSTHGYSPYCGKHAATNKRHGHPTQETITTRRLRPHLELFRSYVDRHGGTELWARLEAVWETAVRDAEGIVAEARSGRPFDLRRGLAAAEIVRVAESAPARRVVEVVAAMAMMNEREPAAFRSDDAHFVETARRVRALSPANAQRYVSARDGKRKTVLRDLRRDAAIVLGRMLLEVLGPLGGYVLRGWDAEHEERAVTRANAYAALRPALTGDASSRRGEDRAGPLPV